MHILIIVTEDDGPADEIVFRHCSPVNWNNEHNMFKKLHPLKGNTTSNRKSWSNKKEQLITGTKKNLCQFKSTFDDWRDQELIILTDEGMIQVNQSSAPAERQHHPYLQPSAPAAPQQPHGKCEGDSSIYHSKTFQPMIVVRGVSPHS